MSRARQNPRGPRVPRLVRVGSGVHTHMLNPETGLHSCRSGINAGRGGPSGAVPQIKAAPRGAVLTCGRCKKLWAMNEDAKAE